MSARRTAVLAFAALVTSAALVGMACGSSEAPSVASDSEDGGRDGSDASPPARDASAPIDSARSDSGDAGQECVEVDDTTSVLIATATVSDEHALTLIASSTEETSWASAGNEALILDLSRGTTLLGHLVLHQGTTPTSYGMHTGALATGDTLSVRVSEHSAANTVKRARVCGVTLAAKATLGALGEGLAHAPVMVWPLKKRFDDLPVLLSWSAASKSYALTYSNENGGTVSLCGGGAKGIAAEVARWGRAFDIESMYEYSGTPTWQRCTGSQASATNAPRMESDHPIFYYGDGHNRLFESRGGYGTTCGFLPDKKADGDLAGWNLGNPGNDPVNDAQFAITLRPLPVPADSVSYGSGGSGAPRERSVDTFAPWLYRLTSLELEREGRIDNALSRAFDRYLYLDLRASDVGGSGDGLCAIPTTGGFVARVNAGTATLSGTRMTQPYFGAGTAWKRVAVALDRAYAPSEISSFVVDAYDNDGIYLLDIGDVFLVNASGANGSTLNYVRKGSRALNVYVDDGSSGCDGGVNALGPFDAGFPCTGTQYQFSASP